MTGVLPTALGRATRIVQTLLKAGKEYIALMHLHKEIEEKKLRNTINEFTGKIKQLPPIKSTVKLARLSILRINEPPILALRGL